MSEKEKDINIITLGECGVGKTSIIKRIRDEAFDKEEPTTEFVFSFFNIKKPYKKLNLTMNLNYHDTAGQEKIISSLPKRYIRNSHIVLLVFSNIQTLNVIKDRWYKYYKENANIDNSRFILIGNKSDIFGDERDEIIKQGNMFAEEIDAHFMTCSAKSDDNLDNVQRYIETEAKRFIDDEISRGISRDSIDCQSFRITRNQRKSHCCNN